MITIQKAAKYAPLLTCIFLLIGNIVCFTFLSGGYTYQSSHAKLLSIMECAFLCTYVFFTFISRKLNCPIMHIPTLMIPVLFLIECFQMAFLFKINIRDNFLFNQVVNFSIFMKLLDFILCVTAACFTYQKAIYKIAICILMTGLFLFASPFLFLSSCFFGDVFLIPNYHENTISHDFPIITSISHSPQYTYAIELSQSREDCQLILRQINRDVPLLLGTLYHNGVTLLPKFDKAPLSISWTNEDTFFLDGKKYEANELCSHPIW